MRVLKLECRDYRNIENLELILIGNGTSITDWNDGGSNNGEATEN